MKRKIKKRPLIILSFLIIGVICALLVTNKHDLKIELVSDAVAVNTDDEIQYKAKFKDEDVSNKVVVDSKIDNKKIGKYNIIFKYNNEKVTKVIKVVDNEGPQISLVNGNDIVVLLNNKFEEPGYNVSDNYDSNVKVNVSGNVDTSKEGNYELKYVAKDSSNNKTEVVRNVLVSSADLTDMDIKDFNLNGYFNDTILESTKDAGESYTDSFIFAGDSVPLYYVISKHISGSQLWHKEGINAEAALVQPIYIAHQTTDLTFVDAFKKYKPNYVIMTLGMNSVATMTPDYFIDCYKKLLKQIMDVSPNTKIIINSIPPVDSSLDEKQTGLTNKKINLFNYRIVEMCSELKIKFLNSAESLKDENGQCKKGYCYLEKNNYGVHQTTEGNNKVFNYIRTHAIELNSN